MLVPYFERRWRQQETVSTHEQPKSIYQDDNSQLHAEGVPASIGFSKDKKIIVIAKVTSNDDGIDISAGEVYDVTGPQREYEVCNLNAKLSLSDKVSRLNLIRMMLDLNFLDPVAILLLWLAFIINRSRQLANCLSFPR